MSATKKQRSVTKKKAPVSRNKTHKKASPGGSSATALIAPVAVAEHQISAEPVESDIDSPVSEYLNDTETNEMQLESSIDVSQQATNILSIIEGLEGQVDTAFKLKDALESDLGATRQRLSEELSARTDLDTRVKVLEAVSASVDQLREDLSFVEEERNKFSDLLDEVQPQLEAVSQQRDLLVEQAASDKQWIKELEDDKMTLEAKLLNLKDEVEDMKHLRQQLTDLTDSRDNLNHQVRDITSRLEESDSSKNTLEADLKKTQADLQVLQQETDNRRQKESEINNQLTELHSQLAQQETINKNLLETISNLESEMRMSSVNHESAEKELESAKNALQEICFQATRTSGRVRQRYFKTGK